MNPGDSVGGREGLDPAVEVHVPALEHRVGGDALAKPDLHVRRVWIVEQRLQYCLHMSATKPV